jgi:hypothetical protein
MHIPATKNLILPASGIVSLTAFKGLVHTLEVGTKYPWYLWFQSLCLVLSMFQNRLSYTRNCIHLGKVGMKNLLTFNHFWKVCDPLWVFLFWPRLGSSLFVLPSLPFLGVLFNGVYQGSIILKHILSYTRG